MLASPARENSNSVEDAVKLHSLHREGIVIETTDSASCADSNFRSSLTKLSHF